MKREKSGVHLLLGLLLLFSISVGMLYGDKKGYVELKPHDRSAGGLATVSVDRAVQELAPFIQSRSKEQIVDSLEDVPVAQALAIIKKLLDESQVLLTGSDLVAIIYGVMLYYPVDVQYQFLDLIPAYPRLQGVEPLLFVAAHSSYPQAIPTIRAWSKKRLSDDGVARALTYAVEHDALDELRALHDNGITFTQGRATDLLWLAVNNNKSAVMVTYLINVAGAQVNSKKDGHTPLITAVEHNNMALVKTLVQLGAQVNMFVDPAVGTALQQAIHLGYTDIELYLRAHGARE